MSLLDHIQDKTSLLLLMSIGMLLLYSCENDLSEVNRIENIKQEEAVDISKDVIVIYSDSSLVKAKLTGPEMRVYHDSTGSRSNEYEFQKGVQIIFYGPEGNETHRIKSDYGKQRLNEGITEFKKNVVITRDDGSIINTEELYFDEKKQLYYNNAPISFNMKDETSNAHATAFTADSKFRRIIGQNMTATKKTGTGSMSLFGN